MGVDGVGLGGCAREKKCNCTPTYTCIATTPKIRALKQTACNKAIQGHTLQSVGKLRLDTTLSDLVYFVNV